MSLIILPHHLYNKKIMNNTIHNNNINNIVLLEHPHYFTKYNYNKKKIMLHRASMKYYLDYLQYNIKPNHDHSINCKYVNFYDRKEIDALSNLTNIYIFDSIDKIDLPKHTKLESPNFLINTNLIKEYRTKTDKFFFHYFYSVNKNKLNIIPNIKSKDKYNRKPLNVKINIPKPFPSYNSNIRNKYIRGSIKYIKTYFNNNVGNVDHFNYPITHKEALLVLKYFIKYKLTYFGPYQDAINNSENYLFHSLLSSSINIGLLNPDEIVRMILKYRNTIPINSLEGFIRQLFWREYQRYCYIYYNFNNKNYFGNTKLLTTQWYTGQLNIKPVDDCIKKAFDTGYLHHIERLMIVGNYMNLSGIKPKEGFRWFMEFSCDSYEWVMCQNVYDMVFYVSGGVTMRRPYISSSNYILNMSNYDRDDWTIIWNKKYQKFIKKHYDKLAFTGYYGIKNHKKSI